MLGKETEFSLQLIQHYGEQHTLGHFRLAALTQPTPLAVPQEVREVLTKSESERGEKERALIQSHVEQIDAATRPILAESRSAR